jgi:hypothetical protein
MFSRRFRVTFRLRPGSCPITVRDCYITAAAAATPVVHTRIVSPQSLGLVRGGEHYDAYFSIVKFARQPLSHFITNLRRRFPCTCIINMFRK